MDVYFPTSSLIINSGYYTGVVSCAIKNNSSKTIKLTKFQVFSTGGGSVPIEITDEAEIRIFIFWRNKEFYSLDYHMFMSQDLSGSLNVMVIIFLLMEVINSNF